MPVLLYNMTDNSTAACNLTYYGIWAGMTGFDPVSYSNSVNSIPQNISWDIIRNDSALTAYFEQSQLGNNLGRYFGEADVYRDRCAIPDTFQGIWDMSAMLACPTIYTFPHFLGAGDFVVNSTGKTFLFYLFW